MTTGMADLGVLDSIQRRVLWPAVRMADHANHDRLADEINVGGIQASSASMVGIMTALWFGHLTGDDKVAVKPHALGLGHELHDTHLLPIGTVNDPFVCRGLDAIIGADPEQLAQLGRTLRQQMGAIDGVTSAVSGSQSATHHLARLLAPSERHLPIVTVRDAARHQLAWLAGVFGTRVLPVGVDEFGQSGSVADLYCLFDLSPDQIVNAALVATA